MMALTGDKYHKEEQMSNKEVLSQDDHKLFLEYRTKMRDAMAVEKFVLMYLTKKYGLNIEDQIDDDGSITRKVKKEIS